MKIQETICPAVNNVNNSVCAITFTGEYNDTMLNEWLTKNKLQEYKVLHVDHTGIVLVKYTFTFVSSASKGNSVISEWFNPINQELTYTVQSLVPERLL